MNTGKLLRPFGWVRFAWPLAWSGAWLRAARDWRLRLRRAGDADSTHRQAGLLELDARTLRDIGAPEGLQARAMRRRQARRDRLDDLRAGGAAGDWQGW